MTDLQQRFNLIRKEVLNLPSTLYISVFINDLLKSSLSVSEKSIYIYLALYARYPHDYEIERMSHFIHMKNMDSLLKVIQESFEYDQVNNIGFHFHLKAITKETLLIDVSHTINYDFHSGIQKVVRQFCEDCKKESRPFRLIKFCLAFNHFELVNEDEEKYFFDWHSRVFLKNETIAEVPNPLKKFFNKVIKVIFKPTAFAKRCIKFALRKLDPNFQYKYNLRQKRLKHGHHFIVPLIRKNNVFLPELAVEPLRIHTHATISSYLGNSSSMIVYDLIPIMHPNLCLVGLVFMQYFMLVKSFKKVSCISADVAEHAKKFLDFMNLEHKSNPQIAVNYLGSELTTNLSQKELKLKEPLILCVGTFEPRKNHMRIFRAAERAWEKGHKFKLICVGNPGWLNDSIVNTYGKMLADGCNIEIKKNISEAELVQLYKASRFTVFCSISEGFGLPVVESVTLGTPCITSNRGSMHEIGQILGGCYYVDPESVDEIENGFIKMLNDQALLDRLKKECMGAKWRAWSEYSKELYDFVVSGEIN